MTFAQLRARHPDLTDDQILAMYGAPSDDMGEDPDLYANPFVVTPDGRTVRMDGNRNMAVTQEPEPAIDYADGAAERGLVRRGDRNMGMMRDKETGELVPDFAMSVGAPMPGSISNDPDPSKIPEGSPRSRPDLERAGYRPKLVAGDGDEATWIYSPTGNDGVKPTRARLDAMNENELSAGMSGGVDYQREQRIKRYADKLGVPESVVIGMLARGGEQGRGQMPGDGEAGYNSMNAFAPLRQAARDARRAELASRQEAWRAQMMLGGGRQAAKPMVNAWVAMDDPNISPEQRQAIRYMLPGGQLAAAVDAQSMQNAADIIKRFNTAGALGMANTPAQQAAAEAQQLVNQQRRDEMRASDEDILGDKYAPSTPWQPWLGYDEFTVEEQQQMYDELIQRGYKPAEAQRAVDRQAGKRRASRRATWGRSEPRADSDPSPVEPSRGPGGLPVPPGSTPYRYGA